MLLRFIIIIALTICPALSQHGFQTSITCYTKYEHEESRSKTSNHFLGYAYHEAEITNYATPDGELCSKIGCACFSYHTACSNNRPGVNHYSQCTEDDRQNRVVKWHRGWTSYVECEKMRQQSQLYQDFTCCYTDKCNNQPGKIIKIVDSQIPIQSHMPGNYHGSHYGSVVQPTPMYIPNPVHTVPYNPNGYIAQPSDQNIAQPQSQNPQYQTHRTNVHQTRSSTFSTIIQRSPQATKSYADYEQSYSGNHGLVVRSFSNWCIFLSALLSIFVLV